jgi:hypothetical protein
MNGNTIRRAAVLAFALVFSAPTTTLAGGGGDPNVGDVALGSARGVRYRSESAVFDAVTDVAEVQVGCGGPVWHLIGGGSQSAGPAADAWISHSRPVDFTDPDTRGDDGWLAGGHGTGPAEFTGYSICVRDEGLRYPIRMVGPATTATRIADVNCVGAASHVTSGSAFIASTGSWINSSYPKDGADPDLSPDDGWNGRAFDSLTGSGAFSVYAVCARGQDLRYATRREVALSAGQNLIRRVGCKDREQVVGGGAVVTGTPNNARLVASFPVDDADANTVPDDGWESRVEGLSGIERRVTAYAICRG